MLYSNCPFASRFRSCFPLGSSDSPVHASNYKSSSTTSTYYAAGRRTQIVDWSDIPGPDNNLQGKRDLAYNADGQII